MNQVKENIPHVTRSLPDLVREMERLTNEFGHAINLLINQWLPETPAQIVGDEDDYNIGDASVIRFSTDASHNFTGFANGEAGRFLLLINVGAEDGVINHQNVGSVEVNRVITKDGLDLTIVPSGSAWLFFDDVSERWRVIS